MINALACGRRLPVMIGALLFLAPGACSRGPAAEDQTEARAVVATAADATADIRAALADQNLGVARERARAAQAAHPVDAEIHLLAAQVEALLNNAGDSAAAFLKAMDAGLQDPSARLNDPVFAGVRDGAAFAPVRRRLRSPAHPIPVASKTKATPPGRDIRAGDVAIIEDEAGTRIRAGDLIMDTRN